MSQQKPLTVTLTPGAAAMLEAMMFDGAFPDVAQAVEGLVDERVARHDDDPTFVAALRHLRRPMRAGRRCRRRSHSIVSGRD
jgi:hypothetical protein